MRQAFFLLLLLAISALPLKGQFFVAPKFGVNGFVTLENKKVSGFEIQNGYQGGIEFGAKLLQVVGFKAELLYANHSFNSTKEQVLQDPLGQDKFFLESVDINNGTIEANASVFFALGDAIELSAGPELSYLLSSKGEGEWLFNHGQDSVVKVDYNYLDDPAGEGAYWNYGTKNGDYFENIRFKFNLGIAFQLFRNFYLDVRTNYSLTDLINDYYQEPTESDVRYFDFILTASYRFPLRFKKKPEDGNPFLPSQQ